MKIAIFISKISCGGAERVAALLANGLDDRGYEVSLITLAGEHKPFYPLNDSIRRIYLDQMGESRSPVSGIIANIQRVRALKKAVEKINPDVLISFMTPNNVLAALTKLSMAAKNVFFVGSERINPKFSPRERFWRAMRSITYSRLDLLTGCSEGVTSWFQENNYRVPAFPIPNPVCLEERPHDPGAEEFVQQMTAQHNLLAMGRLTPQKGFDMLLRAFAMVPDELRRSWNLTILGEGPMRRKLESLRDELGLSEKLLLPGSFTNPYPILRRGDIFVMSSLYEGFPNSLTEAMACGLPAISFDCDYGPREIIRDDVDGLLVPPKNANALTEAMERLMSDEKMRQRMAERAPEVLNRFSLGKILDRWEKVLVKI